jgi:hypothetical protein
VGSEYGADGTLARNLRFTRLSNGGIATNRSFPSFLHYEGSRL